MPIDVESRIRSLDRKRFDTDGGVVTVWFGERGSSRHHDVRLRSVNDGVHLEATVVTGKTLKALEANEADPHLWAWCRNRVSNLVGFRVDGNRRMIAEAVAPDIDLTQDEFEVYLMAVAAEADRLELVLTGQDVL